MYSIPENNNQRSGGILVDRADGMISMESSPKKVTFLCCSSNGIFKIATVTMGVAGFVFLALSLLGCGPFGHIAYIPGLLSGSVLELAAICCLITLCKAARQPQKPNENAPQNSIVIQNPHPSYVVVQEAYLPGSDNTVDHVGPIDDERENKQLINDLFNQFTAASTRPSYQLANEKDEENIYILNSLKNIRTPKAPGEENTQLATMLSLALRNKFCKSIKEALLEKIVFFEEIKFFEGQNFLHIAVESGDVEYVEFFSKFENLRNEKDANGKLPLHYLANSKATAPIQTQIVKILSTKPLFNIDIKDAKGLSALDLAIAANNWGAVDALIHNKASYTIFSLVNCTDIHILTYLIRDLSHLNLLNSQGERALNLAAKAGNCAFINIYKMQASGQYLPNSRGYSPLHCTLENIHLSFEGKKEVIFSLSTMKGFVIDAKAKEMSKYVGNEGIEHVFLEITLQNWVMKP